MKKKLFFKLFVFTVIAAFVTVTSCKDYDDDISKLNTELSALKAAAVSQSDLTALKTQLESSIASVNTELQAAKTELAALKGSAATKEELDAVKANITALATRVTALESFKTKVETDIATLKADVLKAATKEELEALKTLLSSDISQLRQDVNAKIANLEAILDVANGKSKVIADIQSELGEQMVLINANKDKILEVKGELDGIYTELTGEIGKLKTDLGNLASKVGTLQTKVNEFETKVTTLTNDLSDLKGLVFDLFGALDKRVYTLTFIPDYSSEDGTPQIVVRGITEWEFKKPLGTNVEGWRVKTQGSIYKGITYLRYNVSPSNVKLTDFEIEALLHKTSLVRAAETQSDPIVLAGEATLQNGVLTVPVAVAVDTYNLSSSSWDYENTNISVALQVKNLNVGEEDNENRLVTSTEYVKANFDLSEGQIALNEKSLKPNGTRLPVVITSYANIAAASHASDISLWNGRSYGGNAVDILNHTINLNDYIYGVFDDIYNDWAKMLDFGFNKHVFKYRLVNLDNEGTDQSNNYVTLDPNTGVIGVKPAGNLVNSAAVGRTPVVEVTALVNGKVHAVGYIKIFITDAFDNSPVQFEFNLKDYVLGCNSVYNLTDVDLAAIDFDQVFNHERIQLGKDAFFQEYRQGGLTGAQVVNASLWTIDGQTNLPGSLPATVGVDASKHVWFQYKIDPATQSTNLKNYLEGNISNDAPHGTYKVVTTLKSNGYRPDVVITWNFKVVLPTYKVTDNTAILKNNKIVVNPTILQQGGKTSTAYEALLNNAFMHRDDGFYYQPLPEDCIGGLVPYFVFTKDNLPKGYAVASNGTQLRTTSAHDLGAGHLAAIIETDPINNAKFYLRLNDDVADWGGSWNNYPVLSEAAKGLVGKSVSVQPRGYINGATYNWIDLREFFNAEFTYPVAFALPTDASVYDQANKGLNVYTLNVYDPSSILVDWQGEELTALTAAGRALIEHYEVGLQPAPGVIMTDWVFAGYFPGSGRVTRPGYLGYWYAPVAMPTVTYNTPFIFAVESATCNIDYTGKVVEAITFPIPVGMQLKFDTVEAGGSTTVVSDGTTYEVPSTFAFTWENGATGAIQEEFKVAIPVTVNHKWGTATSKLVITIKAGSGN